MKYPHLAARLFNTPLLVHPQKLDAIIAGLGPRLLGDGIDLTSLLGDSAMALPAEMFSTRRGVRGDAGYLVSDGVAVISASGGLVHRSRMDANSSYLLGYNQLTAQLEAAMADPEVHAVLQIFDSPGGEVSGAFEYGDRIHAFRGKKPMYAMADCMAASAAFLGGSAFDQLAISQTGYAGSIGVVTRHVDLSGAMEKEGVRVTLIYAGDHKVDGNPYESLPKAVLADMQDEIDGIYEMFVASVARNTGLTPKAIRATQAAMYRGQAAVDVGLASRVATTDELLSELAALRARSFPVGQTARATADDKGVTMSGNTNPGGQLAAQTPAANGATYTQADLDGARSEGRQLGATAERERIQGVLAVGEGLPGHEKLLGVLAYDGATTPELASMAVLKAEKDARAAAIAAHVGDAPPAAKPSAAPADTGAKTKAQQVVEAQAYASENKTDLVTALKKLGYAT